MQKNNVIPQQFQKSLLFAKSFVIHEKNP